MTKQTVLSGILTLLVTSGAVSAQASTRESAPASTAPKATQAVCIPNPFCLLCCLDKK